MKSYILIFLLLLSITQLNVHAQQDKISGHIYTIHHDHTDELIPLEFANVYWEGTTTGTITDASGYFSLEKINSSKSLIVNYVGYKNDTIFIGNDDNIRIVLTDNLTIDEVTIHERLEGSYISKLKPIHTEVITSEGLQKLACCNLAESFENSATVDVGFTDAISGARQIKMLGLGGEYAQILTENVPANRGLSNSFGLDYIPGTWMESIYVSKGTASVTNGYESITGQINVEFKKPDNNEKLFLNFYGNSNGRLEGNLNSSIPINKKIGTGILVHTSIFQNKIDKNGDGFLDLPMKKQANIFNRWTIKPIEDVHIQFGLKALYEARDGGQTAFYNHTENLNDYGLGLQTASIQLYNKSGMGFHHKPYKSIALISSFSYHDMEGFFGNTTYRGNQKSFYSNLIYQSIVFNTNHTFNAGASMVYDEYHETFNDSVLFRTEMVPGIFGQYTYRYLDKFTFIGGVRFDYNDYFDKYLVTPRLHMKYNVTENTTIRASFGKGYRSPHMLAENLSLLASSRRINFTEKLDMEEAYNYGVNLNQRFFLGNGKKVEIAADYYRTTFRNLIVVDKESDIMFIHFYNLSGKAYSNSYQLELGIVPVERMDITLAYKYNDVKTTIRNKLVSKPLVNKYKGLFLISYATRFNIWKIDITNQFIGRARLPDTHLYPEAYQLDDFSKSYYILHAQITKRFKHFDLYLGGENITNFKQHDPIISSDDPFGDYFDASNVWGPVHGSVYYLGIRYSIK